MIKNIVVSGFLCLPILVWADSAATVHGNSTDIIHHINSWDNTVIKQKLQRRFSENMNLLEFIALLESEKVEENRDIEKDFKRKVNNIIQDQVGLNYFSKNLIHVATKESIDLDRFLKHQSVLKSEYDRNLNNIAGVTGARILVNRLLYLSLMEKYSATDKI